jgi:hypothetical protein
VSRDQLHGAEHLAARRATMLRVFRAFSARWPKAFAMGRADELMPIWLQSLSHVDTTVLEPAAIQFAAEHEGRYPPDPPDFARFARQMEQRHFRADAIDKGGDAPLVPSTDKQLDRIDQMGRWAHKRLGSWGKVATVWALLWETAPDDAARTAVRDGTLDREVFRDAVEAVERGVRPTSARHLDVGVTAA